MDASEKRVKKRFDFRFYRFFTMTKLSHYQLSDCSLVACGGFTGNDFERYCHAGSQLFQNRGQGEVTQEPVKQRPI